MYGNYLSFFEIFLNLFQLKSKNICILSNKREVLRKIKYAPI